MGDDQMATFRYAVRLDWTGASGSPGVNVFHGRTTGSLPPSGGDVDGLSSMMEDFYTAIAGFYPGSCTIRSPEFASGIGDDEGDQTAVVPWSVTGTGASEYLPPASCVLVDWKTSGPGRRGRGRTFLSPMSNDTIENNGTPSETTRTILGLAIADLVEASDSFGNGAWGVYSRAGSTFYDLTGGVTPNIYAVLRSRRD
jgi:hypothetical protein